MVQSCKAGKVTIIPTVICKRILKKNSSFLYATKAVVDQNLNINEEQENRRGATQHNPQFRVGNMHY